MRPLPKYYPFALAFIFVLTATGIASAQRTGEWSKPVDGLRGRLSLSEDKPFRGTRMLAVYLELENVSDIGDPMEFYFEPTRSVVSKVVDAEGKDVVQPPNGASIASSPPSWLSIPWDGSLRFRISVSGYGVYDNSGTQIQMNSGSWLIRPGDKKKYFLEVSLVSKPPIGDKRRAWIGELRLPKLPISGNKL